MTNPNKNTFKLVLVGDARVGKSAFIHRFLTGNFLEKYTPTLGVEVHPLVMERQNGDSVTFNVWDCAGDPKFSGLADEYYKYADCAIIMFDLMSDTSIDSVPKWLDKLNMPDIPKLVVGTKTDLPFPTFATKKQFKKLQKLVNNRADICFQTSARSCYHFDKPFSMLAQKLTRVEFSCHSCSWRPMC